MNDDWLQGQLNIFDLNQYQIVIDEMTILIELITLITLKTAYLIPSKKTRFLFSFRTISNEPSV